SRPVRAPPRVRSLQQEALAGRRQPNAWVFTSRDVLPNVCDALCTLSDLLPNSIGGVLNPRDVLCKLPDALCMLDDLLPTLGDLLCKVGDLLPTLGDLLCKIGG